MGKMFIPNHWDTEAALEKLRDDVLRDLCLPLKTFLSCQSHTRLAQPATVQVMTSDFESPRQPAAGSRGEALARSRSESVECSCGESGHTPRLCPKRRHLTRGCPKPPSDSVSPLPVSLQPPLASICCPCSTDDHDFGDDVWSTPALPYHRPSRVATPAVMREEEEQIEECMSGWDTLTCNPSARL
eukprot:Polyplicarium_translucidae@DN3201_c0_g1_i2.p1